MRIAVNHSTRMQRGYVCVAGVDVETGRHVRPVVGTSRLAQDLLARHGGPFDLATVVDLGATTPVPVRPEVEDHEFSPREAKSVERLDSDDFWKAQTSLAQPRLKAIFGPDLRQQRGGAATVKAEAGQASLGCLVPSGRPELYPWPREGGPDQIRMRVSDGELDLDLSVTDIRLYGDDRVTPDSAAVQRVSERLAGDGAVVVSVGLTRPFTSSPDSPPVHWLQVNNIHLEADPAWRLGSQPAWRRLIRLIFDF